jgi:hypothetical protein
MPDDIGSRRMADLFEQLRRVRAAPGARYETEDVCTILYLVARGYSVAEIERRTLVGRSTINRWRDSYEDGTITLRYPDIREVMEKFQINVLPEQRVRRERPMLVWQQTARRLEDRPNPYLGETVEHEETTD